MVSPDPSPHPSVPPGRPGTGPGLPGRSRGATAPDPPSRPQPPYARHPHAAYVHGSGGPAGRGRALTGGREPGAHPRRGGGTGVQLRRGAPEIPLLLRGAAVREAAGHQQGVLARRLGSQRRQGRGPRPHRRLVRRRRPRQVRPADGGDHHHAGVGRGRVPRRVRVVRPVRLPARQPEVRQRLLPQGAPRAERVVRAGGQRRDRPRVVGSGRGHADGPPRVQDRRDLRRVGPGR